jgi:hypothetical protein
MEHADHLEGRRKRGLPSKAKAKTIMRHGEIKGHPLTVPQKGLMGMIAGGGTPTRLKKRKKRGKHG